MKILSVKKEAKLSASELAEVKVGKGQSVIRVKKIYDVRDY